MKFCIKCGRMNLSDTKACIHCGFLEFRTIDLAPEWLKEFEKERDDLEEVARI